MKKLSLLLIISVLFGSVSFAQIRSQVDERFELTSIAFRLAGIYEYSQCDVDSYAQDIDSYFAPYAADELISYIRFLRENYSIGYDAVPSTASLLEIRNGKIRLKPQYQISDIPELDNRWKEDTFSQYLKLLNKFYKDSDFKKFYEDHKELYKKVELYMDESISSIDLNWFDSFYGKPFENNITVYASVCNGPNNYAFTDGILIGVPQSYNLDLINYSLIYTVLHEIGHHFANDLFLSHWTEIKDAAEGIYNFVQEEMYRIGYGSARTTLCEWMNNLFILMYYKELPDDYGLLGIHLKELTQQGFIWMPRSVDFMENFYVDRTEYPHIEDFMPQLILFLNYTKDNFDIVQREYAVRNPYIVSVYPMIGSDLTNSTFIKVSFSEPMRTDCRGIQTIFDPDIERLPIDYDNSYWENDRTFVISFHNDQLNPDTVYGIELPVTAFMSDKNYRIDQRNTKLIFNTLGK